MATMCDVCKAEGAYRVTVARAGKNLASMDICDACVEKFAATTPRYPKRAAAARRRLKNYVPRELTDSIEEESA